MNSLRQPILAIAAALVTIAAQAQLPVLNSYPSARATVYLDFDGQYVQGTIWNIKGPIDAQAAGLPGSVITEIFNRIADYYNPFNLNITTDSNIFNRAPLLQRIRIIFTANSSWFGSAGGASGVGSFTWGDDTPGWVFCDLLGNNARYIADAASHEIGHTLGLQHQSIYDAKGNKIAEYNGGGGSGELGWAPIMGVSYYKTHAGWLTGTSTLGYGSIQNDLAVIAGSLNNFGFRKNDSGEDTTAILQVSLAALRQNEFHLLSWKLSSPDSIDHYLIELTKDGIPFQTLATLPGSDHIFSWHPSEEGDLGYRIRAIPVVEERVYYSNTVTLKAGASGKRVRVLDNPVLDLLTVSSNGNFSYQLLDAEGRIISKGLLHTGINPIPAQNAPKGLLILHWEDPTQQGAEKLIKQ